MAKKEAEAVFPRWMYRNGTSDGRTVETPEQEDSARAAGYVDLDEIEALGWNGGVPQIRPDVVADKPAKAVAKDK